ncbi:hypothetical protein RM96_19385 [Cupriavidus sp. IDO]|nr:hypothetical protein RM96_19385 [Cupriavidus sp. IDO]
MADAAKRIQDGFDNHMAGQGLALRLTAPAPWLPGHWLSHTTTAKCTADRFLALLRRPNLGSGNDAITHPKAEGHRMPWRVALDDLKLK